MAPIEALTGVLLLQLGSPDEPTPRAYREYLREFLTDRRVIEDQGLVWRTILELLVLPRRPRTVVQSYREIWPQGRESPLLEVTRRQAELLAERLGPAARVRFAMRYGKPRVDAALDAFAAEGVERIVAIAMYPQYSAAATASAHDDLFRALSARRFVPAVRTVSSFHDHPGYLEAQAERIRETVAGSGAEPEVYVFSFHGIPVEYAEKGDPYPSHCESTARGLAERLGLPPERTLLTYQSQFGKKPWLDPKTEGSLVRLAREGVRRVLVASPGFTTDCLETIYEIGTECAHAFREAGGETLLRTPCLNEHPRWIDALEDLVRTHAAGWLGDGDR